MEMGIYRQTSWTFGYCLGLSRLTSSVTGIGSLIFSPTNNDFVPEFKLSANCPIHRNKALNNQVVSLKPLLESHVSPIDSDKHGGHSPYGFHLMIHNLQ